MTKAEAVFEKIANIFEHGPVLHSLRKNMEGFIFASKNKSVEEFLKFKDEIDPMVMKVIHRLPKEFHEGLRKEWHSTINRAAPKQHLTTHTWLEGVKAPQTGSTMILRQPNKYTDRSRFDGGQIRRKNGAI